jgi:hypothetical protein
LRVSCGRIWRCGCSRRPGLWVCGRRCGVRGGIGWSEAQNASGTWILPTGASPLHGATDDEARRWGDGLPPQRQAGCQHDHRLSGKPDANMTQLSPVANWRGFFCGRALCNQLCGWVLSRRACSRPSSASPVQVRWIPTCPAIPWRGFCLGTLPLRRMAPTDSAEPAGAIKSF